MKSFSWKYVWVFSLAWFGSMRIPFSMSQDAFTNSTTVCVLHQEIPEIDFSLDCIGDLEQDAIMYISGIYGGSRPVQRCVVEGLERCCYTVPREYFCPTDYTQELANLSRQCSGTSQADFQLKRPGLCGDSDPFTPYASLVVVDYGCISVGLLNDFGGNYTTERQSPVYIESNSFFDNSGIEANSTLQCLLVTDCGSTITILAHYLLWFNEGDSECSETYYFQDAKQTEIREWRECPETGVVLNDTVLTTVSNAALLTMTLLSNHTGKVLIRATSSDPNGVLVLSCGSEIFHDSDDLFNCQHNDTTSSITAANTKFEEDEINTSEVTTDEFTTSEVSTDKFNTSEVSPHPGVFINSKFFCTQDDNLTEFEVNLDCNVDLGMDAILYFGSLFGGANPLSICNEFSTYEECCFSDQFNETCLQDLSFNYFRYLAQPYAGKSQAVTNIDRPFTFCGDWPDKKYPEYVSYIYFDYGCVSVNLLNDFAGNYTIERRSPVYIESNSFFDNSDIPDDSILQCLLVTSCNSTLEIRANYLMWQSPLYTPGSDCVETYYFQDAKQPDIKSRFRCTRNAMLLNETALTTVSNALLLRMKVIGKYTGRSLFQATSSDPSGVVVVSCGSQIVPDPDDLFNCRSTDTTASTSNTSAATEPENHDITALTVSTDEFTTSEVSPDEFTTSEVSTDEFTTSEVSQHFGVSIKSKFICTQDDNSTEFDVSLDCNADLGVHAIMYFGQLFGKVNLLTRCNGSSTYEDCCYFDPLEESCFQDLTIPYLRDFAQLYAGKSRADSQIDRPTSCNNWPEKTYPEYMSYIYFDYGCVSVGLLNDFGGNYTIERRSPVYIESNSVFDNSDIETKSTLQCLLVTDCGSNITILANYLTWGPGFGSGQLERCFETYYFQDAKQPDIGTSRECPKWHIVLNDTVLTSVSNAVLFRMTTIGNHTGKVLIQATSSDPNGVIVVSCGSHIVPDPDDLFKCPSIETTSSSISTSTSEAAGDESITDKITTFQVNTDDSTTSYQKTESVSTSEFSAGNVTINVFNATHSPVVNETDPSNNCCRRSVGSIMAVLLVLQLLC